ncbi:hypothetical protein [Streptomyces echinoruber]|uniref:Uncharacterized protein n=1 Tax=Streptomyces echinoruber TaxID=68898 RepID=A0A918VNZ6_9ACTN|nr:hypothetical protein GCM10010389_58250 [Streptomyces echinoruber]
MVLALAYPDAPSARRPGRSWTIRVTGHRDRTASVSCSSACAMPPRSRDVAALRRFAEAHAAAHAKAVTVRADAACACRRQQCAAHEGTRVACAGPVVLVLRHDPAVGQVWTLTEVCSACAPLMSHARVVARAAAPARPVAAAAPAPAVEPESARSRAAAPPRAVPGGFSAPLTAAEAAPAAPRERARRRVRYRAEGAGRG